VTSDLEKEEIYLPFHLPFGPQHPASGHFYGSVKVYGEKVVELEPHPGYLHRGLEKLMEYRTHIQNSVLVDRICVLDPFPNEMGYVNVVEKVAGIEAPERAQFIRTIMAELGRILSHITWIAIVSLALGLDSGARIALGDREGVLRLNEVATGGRIYPCYFIPGGVRRDLPKGFEEKTLKEFDYLESQLNLYDSLVFRNETFVIRMREVGIFDAKEAIALGATGPNLRGCGVESDVRKDEPYAAYSRVNFRVITIKEGDAYSRALCRREEIAESISIVRQLLEEMPEGRFRIGMPTRIPKGDAYFCCEAARGELCFNMVSDGTDKPYRVKVRGPSFSHILSEFPYLARGAQIADIPAIYSSLDPCPADMDR
jgi:NADH-quinone oxidoreductase subunit D